MSELNEMVRKLLYYPDRLPRDLPPPRWAGACEEVWLRAEDGVEVHGLWWPEPAGAPVVLFFHGNAQEVYSWSLVREDLEALGCRLLLIDYHGYGKSGGEPREECLYMDGRAALDWLGERGVSDSEVIVFGKSLGGAVACEVAQGRALRALVLESTFTSLLSVSRRLFPVLPGGVELAESYASAEKIGERRLPGPGHPRRPRRAHPGRRGPGPLRGRPRPQGSSTWWRGPGTTTSPWWPGTSTPAASPPSYTLKRTRRAPGRQASCDMESSLGADEPFAGPSSRPPT